MRKLKELLLSAEACQDLDAITGDLRTEVVKRLRMLKRFPNMGVLVDETISVRAATVDNFRIFYRITRRGVEVIYIRHCRRRFPFPKKPN